MLYLAVFFSTKAARDAGYAALRPLFTGTDHGVSGNPSDPIRPSDWQLWFTGAADRAAIDAALPVITHTFAAIDEVTE